jgi:surface polysaccharide O-acyltransferase-like enzyme
MKPSRIVSFDLARGLAVFFMVMVHVMEEYSTPEVAESVFVAMGAHERIACFRLVHHSALGNWR